MTQTVAALRRASAFIASPVATPTVQRICACGAPIDSWMSRCSSCLQREAEEQDARTRQWLADEAEVKGMTFVPACGLGLLCEDCPMRLDCVLFAEAIEPITTERAYSESCTSSMCADCGGLELDCNGPRIADMDEVSLEAAGTFAPRCD